MFRDLKIQISKVCLCIFLLGFAQNIDAQAAFTVNYHISEIKPYGSLEDLDEKGKQFTQKVIEKANNVSYVLHADQSCSLFKTEDAMSMDTESQMDQVLTRMAKRFTGFNEKVYADHVEDSIVFLKSLVNKDIMVKTGFIDFNWSLIADSNKEILGFEAKKAIGKFYYPVTDEYLSVEAWFVPSIPLQAGPDIFMGLPGLIVEVSLKGAVVTATKIERNKELKIKEFDDSKSISSEEYELLIKRLTKKFIDN